MGMQIVLLLFAAICKASSLTSLNNIFKIRGGLVPQASGEGSDYFEQFDLDYGTEDNVRSAGYVRGLIKDGSLSSLRESDPFMKWLNRHLENGPEPPSGRVKPYYAADFGRKCDLQVGENPKLIIVNRLLHAENGTTINNMAVPGVEVEIRDVWQPWLKPKCDFVVRYIIPNRVNIIEIMESKRQFHSELQIDRGKKAAYVNMVFKPSLWGKWIRGERDVVIKRELDSSNLLKFD